MQKSTTKIQVEELFDPQKKRLYYKINLFDDMEDVLAFNRYTISHILRKAESKNRKIEMVCVGGAGFFKRILELYGKPFEALTRQKPLYLRQIVGLDETFISFNFNSLFIIPKEDLKNIETIWR